ncbi:hypothetical protein FisN_13Lh228 [Fistulifera solaris]|uniref:DEK C-terminal domain-containing protein n=1 Tax=Fistulifera solaris TaxID=1519565 RepID=A0A1Z5KLQ9_FISSO|nr:hypothetical protein FisN_13Lh228 [Fistulifera solaris]|eukprot:GAX27216.1 hypothetical protein FisN_13Lh228 [Fistulifera solaris]
MTDSSIEETKETSEVDKTNEKRSTDSEGPTREKRARKSAEAFVPDDFKHIEHQVVIVEGRGTPLQDLEPVRASIEALPVTAPELLAAHKFLYPSQRKPPKHRIKSDILEFSGFLPKLQEGQEEKDVEESDDKLESEMGTRAYKKTIAELKKMCDVFAIDRKGKNDKDGLVNALLDFLGEPSESLLKGGSMTRSDNKKTKSRAAAQKEDEPLEFGQMPSDSQLQTWARYFTKVYNMEKATIKVALEVASDKFGVDLKDKKSLLKEYLAEAQS